MDPVGAPFINDVHNQTHRQSILGSFLRVRPRGSSQSHQAPPQLQLDRPPEIPSHPHNPQAAVNMPAQPPSPAPNATPGHRRRPAAAGALQASVSHGFNAPPTTNSGGNSFAHILRRRRSANSVLNTNGAPAPPATATSAISPTATDPTPPALAARPATSAIASTLPPRTHRIRLVPHLDSHRSLHFEPISRDVREGDAALRIGRFTDRSGMGVAALNAQNSNKLAFKSKVVSRAHAEIWCEVSGKFFIKDTKSSSGTFLNHVRLSAPNTESRQFPIKDGDVLQLGVDYQGGTEEIYKCVKMRIELGREWQAQANAFNTNALKQLKALSAQPSGKPATKSDVSKTGLSDCCICLFSVRVHQSLFIAPCSHVFHFKCIRPMLLMHHPGFSCPLCRTFANLEEDVEVDIEVETADVEPEMDADTSDNADGAGTSGSGAEGDRRPVLPSARGRGQGHDGMDLDAVANVSAVLSAANQVALQNAGTSGGAETEVERDFAPPSYRRLSAGATLRNNPNSSHSPVSGPNQIPNGNGSGHARRHAFGGVPEDEDEDEDDYGALLETEGEYSAQFDEDERLGSGNGHDSDGHPLPPLPVPSPSMHAMHGAVPVPPYIQQQLRQQQQQQQYALPTLPSSSSAPTHLPGAGAGHAIARPMSVPVHVGAMHMGARTMVVEDFSGDELDGDADGEGFEVIGPDGEGSSGEGVVGAGGKRKR